MAGHNNLAVKVSILFYTSQETHIYPLGTLIPGLDVVVVTVTLRLRIFFDGKASLLVNTHIKALSHTHVLWSLLLNCRILVVTLFVIIKKKYLSQ